MRYEDDFNLAAMIARNGRVNANREALICGDVRMTWAELDVATNRMANAFTSFGLGKGDRVAMLMGNSVEAFLVFWGALKAGCVLVPFNTMLDANALGRMIDDVDPRVLCVDDEMAPLADECREGLQSGSAITCLTTGTTRSGWRSLQAELERASPDALSVEIEGDDIATVIYTSGTTGIPKGIVHSHRARMMYPLGFSMGIKADRHMIAVCATPIYATGTWITMMPAVFEGGAVVLMQRYSPDALIETIEQERGTHVFLVPTQSSAMLSSPEFGKRDLTSLRAMITAGQTLSSSVHEALATGLPGTDVYEVYGMSEGFATISGPADLAAGKQGTVGKPLFMEDIRIVDEEGRECGPDEHGEIVAHGFGMLSGYLNNDELTEEATWRGGDGKEFVRSGDIGRVDSDGYLFVEGRIKDMIKSGGINVYARDIEDVFIEHPGVREVAAIGVPHDKWVETPLLLALLEPGAELDEEELRDWGNARLARYQRVAEVEFRDDFPRATYGKVRKAELRKQYWATQQEVSA